MNIDVKKVAKVATLFLSVSFITLGFNTIDQMIIRYKYYDDWRNNESWAMSTSFADDWWNMYAMSIVFLVVGGFMLAFVTKELLIHA